MAAKHPTAPNRMNRKITKFSAAASATVAVIAMCVSFGTTRSFSIANGVDPSFAWLVPLAVDGTIIAAVVVIVWAAAHNHKAKPAWFMMFAWTAASVWMNSTHSIQALGWDAGWIGAMIHALMPISIWCTVENLRYMLKHSVIKAVEDAQAVLEANARADELRSEVSRLQERTAAAEKDLQDRNAEFSDLSEERNRLAEENTRLVGIETAAAQSVSEATEEQGRLAKENEVLARKNRRLAERSGRPVSEPATPPARPKLASVTASTSTTVHDKPLSDLGPQEIWDLSEELKAQGLSKAKAAQLVGVSHSTYKRRVDDAARALGLKVTTEAA